MSEPHIYGYTLDEIDEVAQEIFQTIAEQQVPNRHALAALCRVITMIGNEEDLDLACSMIDKLAEVIEEDRYGVLEVEDDEDDT